MPKLKYNDGTGFKQIAPTQEEFLSHKADYANPHRVTKKQVGLENVVDGKQPVILKTGALRYGDSVTLTIPEMGLYIILFEGQPMSAKCFELVGRYASNISHKSIIPPDEMTITYDGLDIMLTVASNAEFGTYSFIKMS